VIVKEVGGAARVTKLPWEKKPAAPKSASVASYHNYATSINSCKSVMNSIVLNNGINNFVDDNIRYLLAAYVNCGMFG
jgi:hypothetical protein